MPLPPAVHLLLGPEEGEKARHIGNITAAVEKETGSPPKLLRYYPFEADLSRVLDELRTGDLFASHQIALIKDAHELRKPDADALVAFLEESSPQATVILDSARTRPTDLNKRIVAKIPEKDRKVFWELYDSQKAGWLQNFFASRNTRVTPEASDLMLDMVDNNTRDLRIECEKIALYLGPDTEVGVETIEEYLFHSKQENVFTLFDRLAERDLDACLDVLRKIELEGSTDATALLSGLLWQLRRVLSLHLLYEDRHTPNEAYSRLKIRGKRIQRSYDRAVKSYRIDEVRAIILLISGCDERLRSCRAEMHDLLLTLLLYCSVARGGKTESLQSRD